MNLMCGRRRVLLSLAVAAAILGLMGAFALAQSDGSAAKTPAVTAAKAPTLAPAPQAPAKAPPPAKDRYNGKPRFAVWLLWVLAPLGSIAALVFARIFYKDMMTADEGTDRMKEIAGYVRRGAMAYLKQQYKIVGIVLICASIVLAVLAFVLEAQHAVVPFAFLTGGFFSGLAGFLGMKTATNASARTAAGARESLNSGLRVAFRSGAVMGLVVVGLGLIDISAWFLVLYLCGLELHAITVIMLCFGMGASTQALFARVGGGIYTKAADVGADLVGKVEAGIPEDDPRNPATIADNVGDNVGDVAGMGADLYESYCGSILASAALGVAAGLGMLGVVLPMALAGIGIGASIFGVYLVKAEEGASQRMLLKALGRGVNASSAIIVLASLLLCLLLLTGVQGVTGLTWWGPLVAVVAGLLAGMGIGWSTEYSTSQDFKPTQGIADQAATGPATVIIEGMAVGMRSTWVPVLLVGLATMVAYGFCGGFAGNAALGLFGVGIAAVGMLSTLGITLATDAYGPIADNAGGNAEMAELEPFVRERTDALDALGNTTAATGKGFAIGSAALTALALLAAYMEEVRAGLLRLFADKLESGAMQLKDVVLEWTTKAGPVSVPVSTAELNDFMQYYEVTLMNPAVLVGMFIGAMTALLFCSMTMKAVGRAAGAMVQEVRRQFREIPGIMDGSATPEYDTCVAISTKGAQREMIVPSLLALVVPVAVGGVLGVPGVMGLLAGGLVTGFVTAVMMANAGGAWDNAKKYIESGDMITALYAPRELVEARKQEAGAEISEDGELIVTDNGQEDALIADSRDLLAGDDESRFAPVLIRRAKGSSYHKAAVVGDTVGDPFKDTSGPSLNILIKLMSMVSVVFAGFTVKYGDKVLEFLEGLFRNS